MTSDHPPPPSLSTLLPAADLDACRRRLADGSRSFLAASRLLPRDVADAATALYAFCRVADDRVDLSADTAAAVAELGQRLDRIYAGEPEDYAEDRAFAAVARRYHLPRAWPAALIEGFAWDAYGRRYRTLAELEAYAARVAATVGVMMARLMGEQRAEVLARACDLGVAMQLTNIARDVGEDAAAGRCYLPLEGFAAAGLDVDRWLADPQPLPAVRRMVSRLLARADVLYRRADAGIEALPVRCRPGIRAARLLYAEIGARIAAADLDSVSARAVVGPARKVQLSARALWPLAATTQNRLAAPDPQTEFLLDGLGEGLQVPLPAPHLLNFQGRTERVLSLFIRLAEREQALRQSAS